MGLRAFTSLGAGPDVDAAYRAARSQGGPLAATAAVRELEVPGGTNASKLGTWVQRVAQDASAAGEVPAEHRAVVKEAAAALVADPATCLAVAMEGELAERTKARAGAGPQDRAYLLFGVAAED